VFASQFQQAPVPAVGNIIEGKWFRYYKAGSIDLGYGQIVQSWDTASKDNPFNDLSVCVTALVQGKYIYIIDVFRERLKFHLLKDKVIELARAHNGKVLLIEDASSGYALNQSLFAEDLPGVPLPIPRRSVSDKITRALGASAMIQSGRMFLPERTHWLGDFTGELLGFPSSRHDDQVDALSQLLLWVQDMDTYRTPINEGPEEMPEDGYDTDDDDLYDPPDDPWGA